MFYKLDSTRVTLREYWWDMPNPLVIFAWLTKWLRIRLPGSVDDPNVESLDPFRVAPSELPDSIREKFAPVHEELLACGFHSPVCYRIHDAVHQTDIYQVVYVHQAGQVFARVHCRVWSFPKPPKEYFFTTYVSSFSDGTYLMTTAGKPDMLAPPSCHVHRQVGAAAGALWETHQRVLQEDHFGKRAVPVRDEEELVEAVESHHRVLRDFHVARGVFVPMSPDEEETVMASAAPDDGLEPVSSRNGAVLREIEKLQQGTRGWLGGVLILAISVVFFLALGAAQWSWDFVLLLVGVVFVHELGHYVAMRVFHYRNVRMFFIPLFGAAVSGRHYNVPGWKKVIVSLMGPVPGIFLGIVIGIAGIATGVQSLISVALLALVLNGFNLLPVLPLDGGWIMHALLFSRHYVLDAGFRALAVGALMLGSLALGDRILFFFGLAMAVGLPMAFRMVRVVESLRKSHTPAASTDDQSIPPKTADTIIDEIRRVFPGSLTNKNVAQLTVQAFEALNARPPGVLATIALLGVHAGSFFLALVFGVVFVIAQHVGLGDFMNAALSSPQNPVDANSIEVCLGEDVPETPGPEKTIIATFDSRSKAEVAMDQSASDIPPQATLARFGRSLLLAIPADDDRARTQWLERLEDKASGVHVSTDTRSSLMSLTAIAPNEETAERIEETMRVYFSTGPGMHLIPPWHPDLPVGPEHERARQMYSRLLEMGGLYDDTVHDRITTQLQEAIRQGDEKRVRLLQKEMQQALELARAKRLQELERQAEDPHEKEVVAWFAQRPEFQFDTESESETDENGPNGEEGAVTPDHGEPTIEEDQAHSEAADREQQAEQFQQEFAAWNRRMGELLGQLPLEGDKPNAAAARFSAAGGSVRQTGLMVQVDFVRFDRLVDGPRAMVRWLCEQKCAGLKYAFGEF